MRTAPGVRALLFLFAFITSNAPLVFSADPSWWSERGVLREESSPALDYAAANQGQLKNIALRAYEHLVIDGAIVGGVGPIVTPAPGDPADLGSPGWRIRQLISSWVELGPTGRPKREDLSSSGAPLGTYSENGEGKLQLSAAGAQHNDFRTVSLGQLKRVAAAFYSRMEELYHPFGYPAPWVGRESEEENYAMANIGQIKQVFSFDLHADSDRDGIRDVDELAAGTFVWNLEVDGDDKNFQATQSMRNPPVPQYPYGTPDPGGGSTADLDVSDRIPPPLREFELRKHSYWRPGIPPFPPFLDEDPSKVEIYFKGTELQTSAVIQRREATEDVWEIIDVAPGSEGVYVDESLQVGKIYYYRVVSANGSGQSSPTRMKRWIPPLYLNSTPYARAARVERVDPGVPAGEYQGQGSAIRFQHGPVIAGDSIGLMGSVEFIEFPSHPHFPAAFTANRFQSDPTEVDDSSQEKYTAHSRTWSGLDSANGHPNLTTVRTQLEGEGSPFPARTYLEQVSTEINGGTNFSETPADGRRMAITESPHLRGTDLFSAFQETPGNRPDFRCAKDWGHELFFEKGRPGDQIKITVSDPFLSLMKLSLVSTSFAVYSVRELVDEVTGAPIIVRVRVEDQAAIPPDIKHLEVVPLPSAVPGDYANLKVTFTPLPFPGEQRQLADGIEISDQIRITYLGEQNSQQFEFPVTEATGSAYRRISLSGQPISEKSPENKPEEDHLLSGTYIDALTLRLQHEVSDLQIAVPGADFSLAINRRFATEIWHSVNDLPPDRNLFRPFGAGWSSGLGMNVKIVDVPNQEKFAYVTDYAGAVHRFLAVGGFSTAWLPLPSGAHEAGAQASSLTLAAIVTPQGPKEVLAFTTERGTVTCFEWIAGLQDRVIGAGAGGSTGVYHTYLRPVFMEDKIGNRLNFDYVASDRTLPTKIRVDGKRDLQISIRYDSSNHVEKIWDPNGNLQEFFYQAGPNGSRLLTEVRRDGIKKVSYGYSLIYDAATRPRPPNHGPGVWGHLDLQSITDARNSTYTFVHTFDRRKVAYDQGTGPYVQTGLPRILESVSVPDAEAPAAFFDHSDLALVPLPTTPVTVQLFGNRTTEAKNVEGNSTHYGFNGQEVHVLDPLLNVREHRQALPPLIVFHKRMGLTRPFNLQETCDFDPEAGLALKKYVDAAGKATKYGYNEPASNGLNLEIDDVSATILGWCKYADEPAWVEEAPGHRKYFAYNLYRQQVGTVDETGRASVGNNWQTALPTETKSFQIDLTPAEMALIAEEQGAAALFSSGGPVRKTTYAYEDSRSPGVATRITRKKAAGDPAWAADIATVRELDEHGRILNEDTGGVVTQMTYDRNGNKTSTTDGRGFRTSYTYDAHDRLERVDYPSPGKAAFFSRSFEYDNGGNKIAETDELGRVVSYSYDARSRLAGSSRLLGASVVTTSIKYSDMGLKTQVKDLGGRVTEYTYDALLRPQLVTEAAGTPDARAMLYEYPAAFGGSDDMDVASGNGFQATRVTDWRGYMTRTQYDGLHRPRIVSLNYQDPGVDPLGAGAGVAVTEKTFDLAGREVAVEDPLGKITATEYNAFGEVAKTTFADLTTNEFWHTGTGLRWKSQNELGAETETHYDSAGRPVVELGPDLGNGARSRAEYLYDLNGNVETKRVLIKGGPTPLYSEWTFAYDGRGRKTAETGPEVDGSRPVTRWKYDAVGNQIAIHDARGKTTHMEHDEWNRLRFVKAPLVKKFDAGFDRPITETQYDRAGNVTKVIDPDGRVTINTYTNRNQLKSTTDHAGIVVSHVYDLSGNRVSVTDGKNQVTTFTYDGLSRLLVTQPPLGPPQENVYDAVNRTTYHDGTGLPLTFEYDDRHRVLWTRQGGWEREHRYDLAGRVREVLETVDSQDVPGAYVKYGYDTAGRLINETSSGLKHTYRYDLAGNRIETEYGNEAGVGRRSLVSTYDAAGRLREITEHAGSVAAPVGLERITTYSYDRGGNIVKKVLPNGNWEATTYDALNRRRLHQVKGGAAFSVEQFYDLTGNVRVTTELVAGEPEKDRRLELEYDEAQRLILERTKKHTIPEGPWQVDEVTTYTYDAAFNREWKRRYAGTNLSAPAESWKGTYNALNQLTTYEHFDQANFPIGEIGYTYDNAGNRTSRTSDGLIDIYTYDQENRLTQVTRRPTNQALPPVAEMNARYDYRARRVWYSEQFASTGEGARVSFSGGTSVREDYVGNGLHAEFVRGSDWGGGVGGLLYSLRPGLGVDEPRYTHYNGRGDVILQTDQQGAKTYEAVYEAFGTRTRENGSTADRQRANTKEENETFKFLNEGFRYRDLETGVWLTRDPAGFVDGPNLYAYVRQNPWSKFDPHGLKGKNENDGGPYGRALQANYDAHRKWFGISKAEYERRNRKAWEEHVLPKLGDIEAAASIRAQQQQIVQEAADTTVAVTETAIALTPIPTSSEEAVAMAGGPAAGQLLLKYGKKAVQWAAGKLEKVPNPFGKKGGPAHQGVVEQIKADIESRGLTAQPEHMIVTPNGEKSKRFVDVVGKDADGNVVEMHQVGKQTKAGNPVSREVKALDDVESATGTRPTFHPYNK